MPSTTRNISRTKHTIALNLTTRMTSMSLRKINHNKRIRPPRLIRRPKTLGRPPKILRRNLRRNRLYTHRQSTPINPHSLTNNRIRPGINRNRRLQPKHNHLLLLKAQTPNRNTRPNRRLIRNRQLNRMIINANIRTIRTITRNIPNHRSRSQRIITLTTRRTHNLRPIRTKRRRIRSRNIDTINQRINRHLSTIKHPNGLMTTMLRQSLRQIASNLIIIRRRSIRTHRPGNNMTPLHKPTHQTQQPQ